MKKELLFLSGLLLAGQCCMATELNGQIKSDKNILISIVDASGRTYRPEIENGAYSADMEIETPDIITVFLTYNNAKGEKAQTYTPVFVDPVIKSTNLDIVETDGYLGFVTDNPDNNAFLAFSDFLHKALSSNTEIEDADAYLDSFTTKARELGLNTTDSLASEYLKLWGYTARMTGQRMLEHSPHYKGCPPVKQTLKVKELGSSHATKYFPEFVNAIVNSTGKNETPLSQRIASLREWITDSELLKIAERNLINRFITINKGNADLSGTLASIDSVVSNKAEYAMWVERVNAVRRQMQDMEQAPDDILIDAAGNTVHLSDFKGKYLYIDFWASWCVHCVKEIPALKELEKTYNDAEIAFVSISLDEDMEIWKEALDKYQLEANQFIVNSPQLAENLQLSSIPRYMLYDKDSRLIDANAPRPSDTNRITRLFQSLE